MTIKLHAFRLFKFCCIGGLTTAIYFLVMWCWISFIPSSYIYAVTFAYIFSTGFHYFFNRRYTFNIKVISHKAQISKYIIVCALNYLITLLVVKISVDIYLQSPYFGVFISIVFTVLIGYLLSNYWIFKIAKREFCQR